MYKILSVRFTEKEYNRIFEGVEKPSSYLKELASRGNSFAGEREKVTTINDDSDGMDWLLKVIKKFESDDDFMEKFIKYVGVSMPDKIHALLSKASDHPFAGYRVAIYDPACQYFLLRHPSKEDVTFSEDIRSEWLKHMYDDEGVLIYKEGDMII